jgi:hypothetical protein
MNNTSEGIIEGRLGILGRSDLSPFPLSERFDARLHGAGINDEENAGQRLHKTAAHCETGVRPQSLISGRRLLKRVFLNTRSQQFYFGGGETRHANAETSLTFGEISEVRQPASFSL